MREVWRAIQDRPRPRGLRQGAAGGPSLCRVPSGLGARAAAHPATREISRTTFGWDRDSGRRASFRGRFSLLA